MPSGLEALMTLAGLSCSEGPLKLRSWARSTT